MERKAWVRLLIFPSADELEDFARIMMMIMMMVVAVSKANASLRFVALANFCYSQNRAGSRKSMSLEHEKNIKTRPKKNARK